MMKDKLRRPSIAYALVILGLLFSATAGFLIFRSSKEDIRTGGEATLLNSYQEITYDYNDKQYNIEIRLLNKPIAMTKENLGKIELLPDAYLIANAITVMALKGDVLDLKKLSENMVDPESHYDRLKSILDKALNGDEQAYVKKMAEIGKKTELIGDLRLDHNTIIVVSRYVNEGGIDHYRGFMVVKMKDGKLKLDQYASRDSSFFRQLSTDEFLMSGKR